MSHEKDLLSLAWAGPGSSFMQAQWSFFFFKIYYSFKKKNLFGSRSLCLAQFVWSVLALEEFLWVASTWCLAEDCRVLECWLSVGVFWEKLNEGPICKLCSQQKVDNLDGVTSHNGTIIFEKYYTIPSEQNKLYII